MGDRSIFQDLLLVELLKFERPVAERFYALYREQFNLDLRVPDAVVEKLISVERWSKRKIAVKTRDANY